MVRPGDVIEIPATGERFEFRCRFGTAVRKVTLHHVRPTAWNKLDSFSRRLKFQSTHIQLSSSAVAGPLLLTMFTEESGHLSHVRDVHEAIRRIRRDIVASGGWWY